MAMTSRLAVLVDGDNIGGSHAKRILAVAAGHGTPTFARVYANAQRPSDWQNACGFRMIHAGTGKNAADVLLAIDAVEMALASRVDTFVIASSDGDFTHLALRLREFGAAVTGMGEGKAPKSFRGACTSFVEIAIRPPVRLVGASDIVITELDRKIRAVINAQGNKSAGMPIAALGATMHKQHQTPTSALPDSNWRAYFASRPQLYDLDPRGPGAMVRLRPEACVTAA